MVSKAKKAKVAQRWEEASAELEVAKNSSPADARFSLEVAEEDKNLPSYRELVPSEPQKSGFIVQTAPSSKPEKPRASTVAYNPSDRVLIIIFSSGACCKYENIDAKMWLKLKNSKSTNSFVTNDLASHPYEYCDRSELSEEVNERINYTTEKSSRIQKGRNLV